MNAYYQTSSNHQNISQTLEINKDPRPTTKLYGVSQNFAQKVPTEQQNSSVTRTKTRQSNISTHGSNIVNPKTENNYLRQGQEIVSGTSGIITKERNNDAASRYSRMDYLSSPTPEKNYKIMVGIHNIGNTCYMNSVLQCICRLPLIRRNLASLEVMVYNKNSRAKGKLLQAFNDTVRNLNNPTANGAFYPYGMRNAIGTISAQFLGYHQHDSAEFFRKLIEGLNEETSRVITKPLYEEMKGDSRELISSIADRWWAYSLSRDNSLITDIFQGQYFSTISCDCKHKEYSCDTLFDLSLTLPSTITYSCTLYDCFDSLTREISVPEYKCQSCKEKGKCRSKIEFYRLPKVLVIQLKRFIISMSHAQKLDTQVIYPDTLDLKKYCRNECSKYKLHGISSHFGSLSSGHYIADVFEDNQWYFYNDERVSMSDFPKKYSSAYLLFYIMNN
ncbi:hypothetical protein SteCoe_21097 [Stentor coeruleus]|uniref:Ubiquitin carboxyl-terminal hydrolase n=1 Tax=Stentor coeruleus TaxID=5963 RepID=A0A1R2BQD3_9CILI|nr:hypothetical protein SteCoe_21097 [Stentor coeruleus]